MCSYTIAAITPPKLAPNTTDQICDKSLAFVC